MSFEFTLLDALQALRCPVLDALAVFFDQAGARGEIWIAFTAVLLAFRRTRRAGLAMALALCACGSQSSSDGAQPVGQRAIAHSRVFRAVRRMVNNRFACREAQNRFD